MNETKVIIDNPYQSFLAPAASIHIARVDNEDNVTAEELREE